MLKKLGSLAKAVLAGRTDQPKAWRGSSGETVAKRKARQERESSEPAPVVFRLREFKPHKRASKPDRIKRRPAVGTKPKPATSRVSFRPLGCSLTMTVRKGLRFSAHRVTA